MTFKITVCSFEKGNLLEIKGEESCIKIVIFIIISSFSISNRILLNVLHSRKEDLMSFQENSKIKMFSKNFYPM